MDPDYESLAETAKKTASDQQFSAAYAAFRDAVKRSLEEGGAVLVAGNGGSAAEAQHFSAELVGRYKKERNALPSVALTVDTSILTAVGNDYGYDEVFARQVAAIGKPQDLLLLLSTSGNSKNLLRAAEVAHSKGMTVVSLLGKGGGALKPVSDVALVVPSDDTARIQEIHLFILHEISGYIDELTLN